jgi:Carboxypeptidase regulatory-like domain
VAAVIVIVAAAIVAIAYRSDSKRDAGDSHAATTQPTQLRARGSAFDFADIAVGAASRTRLEGEVIDERDQPVGSALVRVMPDELTATTEADGSFAFDELPLGFHDLTAVGGDLAVDDVSIRVVADSEPVILRAMRGATVIVHVSDQRGPLAGASVKHAGITATTDASGTARVRGVAPGFAGVDVSAPRHVDRRLLYDLGVDPGGTLEASVELADGAPIDGSVLGPDGAPAADVAVEIGPVDEPGAVAAKTDASGHWHVDAVAAGAYKLQARNDAIGESAPLELALDGATAKRGIVLKLDAGRSVEGSVVDGAGAPIAGAQVVANSVSMHDVHTTTDARGHFALRGLRDEPCTVYAQRDELATAVNDDCATPLRLVARPSSIAGIVVDSHGAALADAIVRASSEEQINLFVPNVRSDSRGGFDFGGVPPGKYRIDATRAGIAAGWTRAQHVDAGAHDLRIELAERGAIVGRVTADGAPAELFAVQIGVMTWTFRGTHGRFTIDAEPGAVEVRVIADRTNVATRRIDVTASGTADLGDIELHRPVRISGHVRTADGAPVAGAQVSNSAEPTAPSDAIVSDLQRAMPGGGNAITDATGFYELDQLVIGLPSLHVTSPLGIAPYVRVPQTDATIDFTLVAPAEIDGTAPADTFVDAWTDDRTAHGTGGTSESGAFHIDQLLPGHYRLKVRGTSTITDVTLVAGGRVTVDLAH